MEEKPSDEELLRSWFLGEAAAFEAFFSRHYGKVVGFLMKNGLRREIAEEVAQEAFLKAHRQLAKYDSARPAMPWFLTVVKNCGLDRLRAEQASVRGQQRFSEQQQHLGHEIGAGGVDNALALAAVGGELEDRAQCVVAALNELPDTDRKLIQSRVVEEKSYAELALLGLGQPQTNRKRVERALAKLRSWFEKRRLT